MGIGHFLGLMPPDLSEKSQYHGIEMDHLTADIAKLLYPTPAWRQADYTRMPLPEKAVRSRHWQSAVPRHEIHR